VRQVLYGKIPEGKAKKIVFFNMKNTRVSPSTRRMKRSKVNVCNILIFIYWNNLVKEDLCNMQILEQTFITLLGIRVNLL
jgi:hypothetical protein